MRSHVAAFLLLAVLLGGPAALAQEVMPAGITCCNEELIRAAMTEEALARIVAISAADRSRPADYISQQSYAAVRRFLPDGDSRQRLDFLRGWLRQGEGDAAGEEFRALVGRFVLGMTLEIGHTFQDEFDQAQLCLERVELFARELEGEPAAAPESLSRALFRAGVSDRELRRLRALERRWKEAPPDAPPFERFNALQRSATGRAVDNDQRMAFDLAEEYNARFPFLDDFLANYRRLASRIRDAARRLEDMLAQLEKLGVK
jgi:hypothetical protein